MKVAKLGHSCLLVEAASGARILVDPGGWSAVPDEVIAGKLDAVLVTHSHGDHLDEALLGRIEAAHPGLAICACFEIVAQLAEKGITARDHGYQDFEVAGARIEVLEAGHEAVLGAPVPNAAFRIDGELVVTGDSYAVALDAWAGTRILALPTVAPWGTRVQAAQFLERMKPEVAFGVHDAYVTDAFRANGDAQLAQFASEREIRYAPLGAEPTEL